MISPGEALVLRWTTSEPARIGQVLGALGASRDGAPNASLVGWSFANATVLMDPSSEPRTEGRLELVSGPEPPNGLAAAAGRPEVVGLGWATVDLERAARGLDSEATFPLERLDPDPHLGAVAALARIGDGPPIVLLEPSTEGRLAARLARHGEGPAVLYVASPVGLEAGRRALREAGVVTSPPAAGPFGPSVVVVGGPVWQPQVLLVDRGRPTPPGAATIDR